MCCVRGMASRIEIPLFSFGLLLAIAGVFGVALLWQHTEEGYAGRAVGVFENSEMGTRMHKGHRRNCYRPIVLFRVNGTEHRGIGECKVYIPWQWHERVHIRYRPDNPSDIMPDTFEDMHGGHLAILFFVQAFAAMAIGSAVFVAIRRRKNNPPR